MHSRRNRFISGGPRIELSLEILFIEALRNKGYFLIGMTVIKEYGEKSLIAN